jgi:hypothetical protein
LSGRASLSVGGGSVSLEPRELDRLVRSLRQLEEPGAESMAEEISARMLVGQIDLCPTEAELEALIAALERLHTGARDLQGLPALLVLARAEQPAPAALTFTRRPERIAE